MTCVHCGDPVVSKRRDARYCKPRCRKAAERERARRFATFLDDPVVQRVQKTALALVAANEISPTDALLLVLFPPADILVAA